MEVKQYLHLAKKWVWLIILGAILGSTAGYFIASRQPVIYRTSTKIMVSRALDQDSQNYYFWNEIQLAKTYAQLINTGQVLEPLSERLGYPVRSGQIDVAQIEDSLLLTIAVSDGDPQRTADIANNLVDYFIEYNDNLQADRYEASEDTLALQIAQVESQIATLQEEMLQITENSLEAQQQQVDERIKFLDDQMQKTEDDIFQIEQQLGQIFPTPQVTNTPAPSWHIPTATPVPVATPTLSAAAIADYRDLQNRLEEAKSLRALYKNVYSNLLLLGLENSSVDPEIRQNQLQTTLALYQQIYTNLLSSYENVRLARLRSTPNVVQIEKATVPTNPIQPQPVRDAFIGSIMGAFLAGVLAFGIEFLDDTLKTPEDVHNHLRIPVIGLVGEMEQQKGKNGDKNYGVFVAENPLSPITEAFRTLRTNLDFAGVDKPLKTLLVTSASPSEGKSTLAVNLAAVMAQGERRVILVDTDLRRPTLHRFLNISNRNGLSNMFRNNAEFSSVTSSWGDPPFSVVTSGALPPNPTELLASTKMDDILSLLKENSDIVIIDSPPLIVADPIVLSAKVDGILIVIEPGGTKIGAAQVMMEQFQRAGARVVGAVLNPISRRRADYYSKYRYYTTYYYYSSGYNRYFTGNGAKKRTRNGLFNFRRDKKKETVE